MYDNCYGYDHPACNIFNRFCNLSDQCKLLWWHDWFGYGDGYRWYGSLYLQLEYDAGADRGYGHRSCSGYLYRDHYPMPRMYDHRYGNHHAACCGAGSQHHGY